MFDLELPWWEFILRTVVVYVCLMAMVRLSGKRTVGQFTPFDLVVVMLLAEAVTESLTGGDQSLIGGLIAAATLIALNLATAWASSRSERVDQTARGRAHPDWQGRPDLQGCTAARAGARSGRAAGAARS